MPKEQRFFFVYILACDNGDYYTGYTSDMGRRYQEHLRGTAKCKYTRSFKPLFIAQIWQTPTKTQAMKIEHFIKRLSKADKVHLISNPNSLGKLFDCAMVSAEDRLEWSKESTP